jgi:ATP-dependent helicase/nuclease subunit A
VLEGELRDAYAGDGDALELAAAGHGPYELEACLLALLNGGVRSEDLAGDPLAPDRVTELLGRVAAALRDFRAAADGCLARVKRGRVAEETAAGLEALSRWLADAARGTPGVAVLAELASRATDLGAARERLGKWARDDFTKGERAALGGRSAAVAAAASALAPLLAHVASLDLDALPRATRLLSGLLRAVERELGRRGVATFAALLSDAARLLAQRPDVAAAIRRDVDQLLVDEFQDTDPQQCAIVAALALPEGAPPAERPGLFIVGDPKQSIYGWRDADLAAYEAFVDRALAQGGERHRLSVNQRSLPAVLDEVERVIEPVMLREEGVQPAFEPLVPSAANAQRRFEAAPRFAGVEYWIAARWDEDGQALVRTSAGEATRLEARALALDLLELNRQGAGWGSVGVLFRSRGDWDVYLTALREAGVPFAVEGDRSYYRRREIIDASSWVRCVLDPGDPLALVGALRSVVVGVPDAAWIPLWSIGLPDRVARLTSPEDAALHALRRDVLAVAASLPGVPGLDRVAGWEHNLVAALEAIASLRACFEREPADVFVERLREALLLEASEAARFLGPWRVANLERFFRDLTDALADAVDTQSVLRSLRRAVAEEEEMEEEPPHDAGADAVQILTLHGAKGLDFEHVYLMQLHKGTGDRPGVRLDAARIDGALELRLLGMPTLGFDRALARRAQVTKAEHVRLLYVGMTRAKQRLVMSGAWPELLTRQQGLRHVDLLVERGGLPGVEQLEACARCGSAALDIDGVRFALPALRAEAGEKRSPPSAEAAQPVADVARVPMAERRRAAQRRMARPLGGVASRRAGDDAEAQAQRMSGERALPARGAEVARLAGSVVHRVLERLDLSRPVDEALADVATPLATAVATLAPAALREPVAASAARVLDALRAGELRLRLERIRHHVLARELPVLLPAREDDEALAFVSGSIDLVYRDPSDGRLVVVDFKTDDVRGERELSERAAGYARQGLHYARALEEALAPPQPPRVELWFLTADRCVDPDAVEGSPRQLSLTLA